MRAGHATFETTPMEKPLVQVALIPPQGDAFGHAQPMAIGQENNRVIPQAMPPDTPTRLPEAVDFGWGQVPPGTDVRIFVALGKSERRHADLLDEQLSCCRWLALGSREHAAAATTWRSLPDFPEKTYSRESLLLLVFSHRGALTVGFGFG